MKNQKYLGIMVCEKKQTPPFQNQKFYRRLIHIGNKLNIQVFVFSPKRIHWLNQQVLGYSFDQSNERWVQKNFPLPHLIYDRCFYTSRYEFSNHKMMIDRLKHYKIEFLGLPLKGKSEVQHILLKDPFIRPFIPLTITHLNIKKTIHWFEIYNEAFLKPNSGSQGKGTLHIIRDTHEHYIIKGRDQHNEAFELNFDQQFEFLAWLRQFIGKRKYMIQSFLSLKNKFNQPYDVRSLVQKNLKGKWQITGMAIRCGQTGSITSNLHGGGAAKPIFPFLLNEFEADLANHIHHQLIELSERIPMYLEKAYGRLIELGIDLGIDQQGRVWILEINSKPGRAVFKQLKDISKRKQSICNPIFFARYLLDRKQGG